MVRNKSFNFKNENYTSSKIINFGSFLESKNRYFDDIENNKVFQSVMDDLLVSEKHEFK